MLASAFEEFARKALCHESILFLTEVSRQVGRYGDFSTCSGFLGREADQFESFTFICKTYIANGAPEEVNIRCAKLFF
ncbi:unnamed protein product [Choristocarpus tenellus]